MKYRGADPPQGPQHPPGAGGPQEKPTSRTHAAALIRKLGESAARAADAGRATVGAAGAAAAQAGRAASSEVESRVRRLWTPDDPAVILGSATFTPFPEHGPPAEMLSIAWQADALIALSALGVTKWEREIAGVTRAVFHDNLRHQELSRRLFGSDFDAIHRWIDTVPGSGIRGGGILHRLQHGHDLAAVQQLYDQHGLPGVMVWMQHVSQDLCTPTGIPIPVGAPRLAAWLVDSGRVTSGKAALMLSFNAARLTGGMLGGAFALRLVGMACELRRRHQVARRCADARAAWAHGDLDAVIAHYSEARSLAGDDPSILMPLGWAHACAERPAEAFLTFRAAAQAMAAADRTTEVEGVGVSLRGLAYTFALTHATQALEAGGHAGWRPEMERMLRGAIVAFERTALEQGEGPTLRLQGREMALRRRRPFSAAANYYLAARLAWSAPFLPSGAEASRLSGRACAALRHAAPNQPDAAADASRSATRWEAELAGSCLLAETMSSPV